MMMRMRMRMRMRMKYNNNNNNNNSNSMMHHFVIVALISLLHYVLVFSNSSSLSAVVRPLTTVLAATAAADPTDPTDPTTTSISTIEEEEEEEEEEDDDDHSNNNDDGDKCRMDLINNWIADNKNDDNSTTTTTTTVADDDMIQNLLDIQQTSFYKSLRNECMTYIENFNIAAGETCLLQQQAQSQSQRGEKIITYSDFWQYGPANMDGEWSLAVDILFSQNYTVTGPFIGCANSCYTSPTGIAGCEVGTAFNLSYFGSISQQNVCYYKWSNIDNAYNDLKLCSAEAALIMKMNTYNFSSSSADDDDENENNENENDENDMVVLSKIIELYTEQRDSQSMCSSIACEEYTTNNNNNNNNEDADQEGNDDNEDNEPDESDESAATNAAAYQQYLFIGVIGMGRRSMIMMVVVTTSIILLLL